MMTCRRILHAAARQSPHHKPQNAIEGELGTEEASCKSVAADECALQPRFSLPVGAVTRRNMIDSACPPWDEAENNAQG